jgi:hypothetical protein
MQLSGRYGQWQWMGSRRPPSDPGRSLRASLAPTNAAQLKLPNRVDHIDAI